MHTDINCGLEDEFIRRRAHADAGEAFQAWMKLARNPHSRAEAVAVARKRYEETSQIARSAELSASRSLHSVSPTP